MGTAGRGRERASEAPARLVEGRRGAAPDVPVLQSARALPMQPASKRSEQIESAWPFANFTGGMGDGSDKGRWGHRTRSRLLNRRPLILRANQTNQRSGMKRPCARWFRTTRAGPTKKNPSREWLGLLFLETVPTGGRLARLANRCRSKSFLYRARRARQREPAGFDLHRR